MSRQLTCRNMCKIVAWNNHYFFKIWESRFFCNIWIKNWTDKRLVSRSLSRYSCTAFQRRHRWFSTRLQYLQCVSNGNTAVLHWTTDIMLLMVGFLLLATSVQGRGCNYTNFLYSVIFQIFHHCQNTEYHVHVWQVSPQHSCGDTHQIWK